jgi:hypothetical protein
MNNSLRLQLVQAGYEDRSLNNSLTAGCKPSPTLDACYRLELYSDRKTLYSMKKKTIKSRDYTYCYAKISKSRVARARAFEDRFQAMRKADRALKPIR